MSQAEALAEKLANDRRRREEDARIAQEIAAIARQEAAAKEKADKAKAMRQAEARNAEEAASRERRAGREQADQKKELARRDYLRQPIPPDILREMKQFLAAGNFGAEQSPLTYVGYHVGRTAALSPEGRRRRMEVCFRVEIPRELWRHYRHWGEPATTQRLNEMAAHLRRHAEIRKSSPQYAQAVAEWTEDRDWLLRTLGAKAQSFLEGGVG